MTNQNGTTPMFFRVGVKLKKLNKTQKPPQCWQCKVLGKTHTSGFDESKLTLGAGMDYKDQYVIQLYCKECRVISMFTVGYWTGKLKLSTIIDPNKNLEVFCSSIKVGKEWCTLPRSIQQALIKDHILPSNWVLLDGVFDAVHEGFSV